MIRKLKFKFVAINMFLVAIVFFMTFYLIYTFHSSNLEAQSLRELDNVVNMSVADFADLSNDQSTDARKIQFTPLFIVDVDPQTKNIFSIIKSNVSIDDENLNYAVNSAMNSNKNSGVINDLSLRFIKKTQNYSVKLAFMDISREISSKASLLLVFVFTGLLAFAAILVISLVLSSMALKPVAEAWTSQKQFIADASHELKTPLAVLIANMDILENNENETVKSQQKWIKGSKSVAFQMKDLIEEMLFLAKSDAGKIETSVERVNVSDTLISKILSMEAIAYEKKVTMDYENVQDELYAKLDEKQLAQLFAILIDNACKYSKENTVIKFALKKEQEKIKFAINNYGEVMSKGDIKNIFERFYRIEKSRNKEQGGYGLGLAIALKIADANKIRIWVQSNEQNGTTFYLSMQSCK